MPRPCVQDSSSGSEGVVSVPVGGTPPLRDSPRALDTAAAAENGAQLYYLYIIQLYYL